MIDNGAAAIVECQGMTSDCERQTAGCGLRRDAAPSSRSLMPMLLLSHAASTVRSPQSDTVLADSR
jgi:hypothetical protein